MAGTRNTAKLVNLLLPVLDYDDDGDDDEEKFLLEYFMSEENSRWQRTYIKRDCIIPSYSTSDFKAHFRVEKTTFEDLLLKIGNVLAHDATLGRPIDPQKKLLVCLWMLGNRETLKLLSERFNVSKSSARQYVLDVSDILVERAHEYIRWPTGRGTANVIAKFQDIAGFPGILGAVGTTHIHILTPHINPSSYVCHKGCHSIVLQGVCDHEKKFIDCFTGMPGSVSDITVFKTSEIYKKITTPENCMLPDDSHLVANDTYPLLSCLMIPYQDNGYLTQKQKQFNDKLLRSRGVIEHAFGLLKGRFRFLKMVNIMRTDLIPKVITACCVMHNICIEKGDLIADEDVDITTHETDVDSYTRRELSVEGCHKRDRITNTL